MTFLYAMATLWPKVKRIYITLFSFESICTPAVKGHRLVYVRQASLLLLFCFIMFSNAYAQSVGERADAGLTDLKPLQIGDTIPEVLWNLPLQVVNHPDGKDTITMNDYRNRKLIILDFWATWCAPCIKSVKHIDSLISVLNARDVSLLPVNRYDNEKRMQTFMEKTGWTFPSVINNKPLDEILMASYRDYLGVVWILDGRLFAVPRNESITRENIKALLAGRHDEVTISNYPLRTN